MIDGITVMVSLAEARLVMRGELARKVIEAAEACAAASHEMNLALHCGNRERLQAACADFDDCAARLERRTREYEALVQLAFGGDAGHRKRGACKMR